MMNQQTGSAERQRVATRLLIIAQKSEALAGLCQSLERDSFSYRLTSHNNGVRECFTTEPPDIILVEMAEQPRDLPVWELIGRMKREKPVPVVALIPQGELHGLDDSLDIDDFVTGPYDAGELVFRINRLLRRSRTTESHELIDCDGLVVDLATCEVTVEGRMVELTFKEYELLKLLVGNRGRVYTRDALLNRVWGYDYYGGDRTVDVHVRRLRSKIEDSKHNFIETVRNIGYRFRKDV
jgi:two-component system alkaline phosphatase synthesis response regulator PhoP